MSLQLSVSIISRVGIRQVCQWKRESSFVLWMDKSEDEKEEGWLWEVLVFLSLGALRRKTEERPESVAGTVG
jgi:hypothetical protein